MFNSSNYFFDTYIHVPWYLKHISFLLQIWEHIIPLYNSWTKGDNIVGCT